jgi:hypothetical protein
VTNALNRAALARLRDPGLAERIEGKAAFPTTMVDRIAPATRPDHLAHRESRDGLRDAAPVFCERFTQWVIEDRFVAGRPEWEQAGAPFVPDVSPHEPMKLRLLNGGHLAIAAPGRLLGHTHLHEAMAEPRLRGFKAALMERELQPTLRPVPRRGPRRLQAEPHRPLRQPRDPGQGGAHQPGGLARPAAAADPRESRGRRARGPPRAGSACSTRGARPRRWIRPARNSASADQPARIARSPSR